MIKVGGHLSGLDHSHVRLYTALTRHLLLTMATLAVCAVTAAARQTHNPGPRPCPPKQTSNHPRIPA